MTLTANLISFWQLEETSGTRFDAVVATGNDLVDNNTVTQAAGKVNKSAQFTRANSEFLSHVSNTSLQTGDIDFTLAAWFYPNALSADMDIMSRYLSLAETEYELFVNPATDKVEFYVYVGAGPSSDNIVSSVTLSVDTWYFVVARHDSVNNTISVCINNGIVDSKPYSAGINTSTLAPFNISGYLSGGLNCFDGRIDQAAFWKRILTSGEITQLYNGGQGLTYSAITDPPINLVDYSHFPPVNL